MYWGRPEALQHFTSQKELGMAGPSENGGGE